jgi:membrane protease YdiL (CAAX protease family)
MNIAAALKRHPIRWYYVMAFAISWSGSIALILPKIVRKVPFVATDMLLALGLMLLGPLIAGLLMTSMVDGPAGLADLRARAGRWRVGIGWWAVVLLTAPVLHVAGLFFLVRFVSPTFTPGFSLLGIGYGLVAGFIEEVGWMGFAYPKMRRAFGVLKAAVIMGVLHGLWHLAADFLGSIGSMGASWLPHYLVQYITAMTLIRILIIWVYENTQSLLLSQLFHVSSTATLVSLAPVGITPPQYTTIDAVYLVPLAIFVAIIVWRFGPSLAGRPPLKPAKAEPRLSTAGR